MDSTICIFTFAKQGDDFPWKEYEDENNKINVLYNIYTENMIQLC